MQRCNFKIQVWVYYKTHVYTCMHAYINSCILAYTHVHTYTNAHTYHTKRPNTGASVTVTEAMRSGIRNSDKASQLRSDIFSATATAIACNRNRNRNRDQTSHTSVTVTVYIFGITQHQALTPQRRLPVYMRPQEATAAP
jgi:hypothetical protein